MLHRESRRIPKQVAKEIDEKEKGRKHAEDEGSEARRRRESRDVTSRFSLLLIIIVISPSFPERLGEPLLEPPPLTGNSQRDAPRAKRNRRAGGNEREEIGGARMRMREQPG